MAFGISRQTRKEAVVTAERPLYVDAEGTVLSGPQPGVFIARRPAIDVEKMFKGTLAEFSATMSPKDRAIHDLQYQVQELENRRFLETAILNLSQTGPGSDSVRLLNMAKDLGFSFVFDERSTKARGAAGLMDYNNKLVPLRPAETGKKPDADKIAELMHTIKHELQHMEDIYNGAGQNSGPSHALRNNQGESRGMEGGARISQCALVVENQAIQNADPTYYQPKGVAEALQRSLPHMAKATFEFITDMNAGKLKNKSQPWTISLAHKVFPEFWKEKPTLEFYDLDLIALAGKGLPKHDPHRDPQGYGFAAQMASLHQIDKPVQPTLRTALKAGGHNYLDGTGIDLDSPAAIAMVDRPSVRTAYEAFKDNVVELAGIRTQAALLKREPIKSPMIDLEFEAEPAPPGIFARVIAKFKAAERPSGRMANHVDTVVPLKPKPDADFAVIVMPTETPISPTTRDSKRLIGDFAAAVVRQQGYGHSSRLNPVEYISLSIEGLIHTNYSGAMGRPEFGASRDLINHGLRVPIAAFPSDYLVDLALRIRDAKHATGTVAYTHRSEFTDGEKELLQHWQTMARNGIDPLHGNQKLETDRSRAMIDAYAMAIATLISENIPVAGEPAPHSAISLGGMIDWAARNTEKPSGAKPAPITLTGKMRAQG